MKHRRLAAVIVCVVVVCVVGLVAYAVGGDKVSAEFRNQFIKEFERRGLNTTPGDAMMLRILVESSGAQRGVEVGAASGFGAINMGIGFERTGGHLTTLEIDPRWARETRENIRKMGLEETVT